jgi:hypothetical protein
MAARRAWTVLLGCMLHVLAQGLHLGTDPSQQPPHAVVPQRRPQEVLQVDVGAAPPSSGLRGMLQHLSHGAAEELGDVQLAHRWHGGPTGPGRLAATGGASTAQQLRQELVEEPARHPAADLSLAQTDRAQPHLAGGLTCDDGTDGGHRRT